MTIIVLLHKVGVEKLCKSFGTVCKKIPHFSSAFADIFYLDSLSGSGGRARSR